MRILLIEDDPLLASAVRMTLNDEGMVVDETTLGEDGVDMAKVYEFDAILLDLNLPDISGVEVLRQLRAAGVATPVVMLTGQADVGSKVKALYTGADDYVTKPFHNYELTARLRAVVRRSKGFAHSIIIPRISRTRRRLRRLPGRRQSSCRSSSRASSAAMPSSSSSRGSLAARVY